jgi:hypothetical protein
MDWFRWYHGAVTDPKFGLVARRAQASVAEVIACWAFLLEQASAEGDRGVLGDLDFESIDYALGMDDGKAERIFEQMVARGLIDGESRRIKSWEKRQPKRERPEDDSTDRVRRHREKKRQETPADDGVTPCNAKKRLEEIRGDKSNSLSLRSREQRAGAGEDVDDIDSDQPDTDPPTDAVDDSPAQLPVDPSDPPADPPPPPTLAGQACLLLRQAGVRRVNPSHPELLQLLSQGVTPRQMADLADELREGRGAPPHMPYLIATMAGRLRDAAAGGHSAGVLPRARASPGQTRIEATIASLTGRNRTTQPEIIDVTPAAAARLG